MRLIPRTSWLVLSALLAGGCDYTPVPTGPAVDPPADPGPNPAPPAGLWTASADPAGILRLDPDQLRAGGPRQPAAVLTTTSASLFTLNSVAFAPDGSLWLASANDARLVSFDPALLAVPGASQASHVIVSVDGSLEAPTSVAFDAAGRLWVAGHEHGTIVRYDADQLRAGGAQVPGITLAGLGHPTALAFDASGALWVSDNIAHTISRLSPALLTVSDSPQPPVVIRAGDACLRNPAGLAFDADGTLWVANVGCGNVVGFGQEQLAAGGSPLPRTTLAADRLGVAVPVGLAFDHDGELWVLGGTGELAGYPRGSLVQPDPAPGVRLTLPGRSLFWGLAFWPRPVTPALD